ncbi:hypothetical protein FYJ27_05750 [Anaerosalibacter bizertensis]|uniref:SH3 domain-containing protein n=1 Tax=Anaerosalibacter bizertensis TaxID=932217 RepID=A0A844FH34_9FIRM|nr:hypothetical protein [Anaerosalibacter bizertensis]MSS43235.1 hypothetical protein [Anaerosalibacter bizertensis]
MVGCIRRYCTAVIVLIGMLATTSFASAGGHLQDTEPIKEETINMIKEKKDIFREKRKSKDKKRNILKTKEGKKAYKVISETFLLDKASAEGRVVDELESGEIIYLINSHGGYGLFITKNSNKGFVKLDEVNEESEELINITTGVSKVTKTIFNEDESYYRLVKGDNVLIKDYDEDEKEYIIVDKFGKEFKLSSEDIALNGNPAIASRDRALNRSSNSKETVDKLNFKIVDILYRNTLVEDKIQNVNSMNIINKNIINRGMTINID